MKMFQFLQQIFFHIFSRCCGKNENKEPFKFEKQNRWKCLTISHELRAFDMSIDTKTIYDLRKIVEIIFPRFAPFFRSSRQSLNLWVNCTQKKWKKRRENESATAAVVQHDRDDYSIADVWYVNHCSSYFQLWQFRDWIQNIDAYRCTQIIMQQAAKSV